jgi:hypothetical protein
LAPSRNLEIDMNASLKQKLLALLAAVVLNLTLAVGLHQLATEHQSDSAPRQLAKAGSAPG